MSPVFVAKWIFLFACFAGVMFEMQRRKPTGFFCPKCGNPTAMHKRGCRESK